MAVCWDCTMDMHRARHLLCCVPPHNSSAQQVGKQKLNNLLKVTQLMCGQAGIRTLVSLTPETQWFFYHTSLSLRSPWVCLTLQLGFQLS